MQSISETLRSHRPPVRSWGSASCTHPSARRSSPRPGNSGAFGLEGSHEAVFLRQLISGQMLSEKHRLVLVVKR